MTGRDVTLIGAFITAAGVLMPFHKAPLFGSSSLIASYPVIGCFIVFCGLLGGYWSVNNRYWKVYASGYTALMLLVASLLQYAGMLNSLQSSLGDINLGWLGQAYIERTRLSWGIFVIAVGSLLMVKGAKTLRSQLKRPDNKKVQLPGASTYGIK